MRTLATALCLSVTLAGAATAQSSDSLCHHAGLAYSPGAMIMMGSALQICGVTEGGTSVWTPAPEGEKELISANCVSGGREFGHGSILPAGPILLTCSRGIWYPPRE